jgi:hypothetical protein
MKSVFKSVEQMKIIYVRFRFLISLLCVIALMWETKAAADEKPPLTASDVLSRLGSFVAGVTSLDYSETKGQLSGDYSRTVWQEMGDSYHFDWNYGSKDNPAQNSEVHVSYDGEHGTNYDPGNNRLDIQKMPFERLEAGYTSRLYGPLLPFEFLQSQSFLRVKLKTLKSADVLASVVARATLDPDKNRSWFGHPCIAIKISNGYDRWDRQPVDFVAYFSPDFGLFPVAWEMYNKNGDLAKSFWIKKLKVVSLSPDSKIAFYYPEVATFRNNATVHFFRPDLSPNLPHEEIDYIWGSDQPTTFPDLKINSLSQDNFTFDPSIVSIIHDLDAKKVISVPR